MLRYGAPANKAAGGTLQEFDGVLDMFVSWVISTKLKGASLATHFRNTSLDKDFSSSKARQTWYRYWQKEYKTRFVSLSDLKKK